MLGYLSLDIICSSKLTVFLELRSRKTVRFSEQIMSADKYPSIFSRQMKAIVYLPDYFLSCSTNISCESSLKYFLLSDEKKNFPVPDKTTLIFHCIGKSILLFCAPLSHYESSDYLANYILNVGCNVCSQVFSHCFLS